MRVCRQYHNVCIQCIEVSKHDHMSRQCVEVSTQLLKCLSLDMPRQYLNSVWTYLWDANGVFSGTITFMR